MRIFWTILGVLMLLSAGYLLLKTEPSSPATTAPSAPAVTPPSAPAAERLTATPPSTPPPTPVPATPAPTTTSVEVAKAEPAKVEPAANPAPPEMPATPMKTAASSLDTPAPAGTPAEPKPENPAPKEPAAPVAVPAAPPVPPAAVVNPDGSTTLGGKFTIRGKGTAAEPYIITWDQLVSAQDDYSPKDGRTTLPPQVSFLDGKHVQITGNISFPMMMDEPQECLVMLNQWDGCCIGIPPTPYDAIEVKLKAPVTGNDVMASFGTLTGVLKVDPHLVGGWLVGLYLLEDASLKVEAFGGFAP